MLLSVVLELLPLESKTASGTSGRDTQAWFVKTVAEFDAAMSQVIHPQAGKGQDLSGQQKRPYTTSGLMLSLKAPDGAKQGEEARRTARTRQKTRGIWKPVYSGYLFSESQPVYLRFSSLSDDLGNLLQVKMLPTLKGRTLTILETNFMVNAVFETAQEHEWAGKTDYARLVRQAQPVNSQAIDLVFASPTTFRSNKDDIPVPIPEHIVRSWWLHWNHFAPPEFKIDMDWPRFAADCVRVASMRNVSTTHWLFAKGKRGGATGFHGDVSLVVRKPDPDSDWLEHAIGAGQVLRTLGAYSRYCGTGRQTTMGMGQTRLEA